MIRLPAFILVVFMGLSTSAHSHESRPLHIEINETQANIFALQWKIPPSIPDKSSPAVYLEGCEKASKAMVMRVSGSLVQKQLFNCGSGLGAVLIQYPFANPSVSTMIRLNRLSGGQHTRLLGPEETSWSVPEQESKWGIALEYANLGIKHIWGGIDHLLFLVCLLLIAGTGRRILITVTGFTVAHSVTLALSALDIIHVAIAPVEAMIALSIVFLATEIVRDHRETLTWKYPIAVSGSFGLLHGFGFAAVLSEIGLPQTELVTGLLFFNVGVEIGQIVFVLAVIAVIKALKHIMLDIKQPQIEKPAAYVVGILATYWMIERITGFWV